MSNIPLKLRQIEIKKSMRSGIFLLLFKARRIQGSMKAHEDIIKAVVWLNLTHIRKYILAASICRIT